MAARASTGMVAGRGGLNIAGSQYSNTDLAEVVASLEALDLAHAPPGALVPLLAACAATEGRIAVRLATASAEAPAAAPGPEILIPVKAGAARLGKSPKWLYRRKRRLPFMCELEPGSWGVHVPTFERWMAARARRSP
jgi:hypothetical protein